MDEEGEVIRRPVVNAFDIEKAIPKDRGTIAGNNLEDYIKI